MLRGPLAVAVVLAVLASGAMQTAPEPVVSVGLSGVPETAVFAGPYLATAAWSNVALIDVASGLTAARLPQGSLVTAMEASPSGDVLAVGTCDHAIQLWRVASRTRVRTIDIKEECPDSMSFSPDGTLIATDGYTCCPKSAMKVWDVRTGTLVRELAQGAEVRTVVFGGNGRWLAGVTGKEQVLLFEWPSGRQLRTFTLPRSDFPSRVKAMSSRDGRYLVVQTQVARAWDVATGAQVLEATSGDAARFLEDGRFAFLSHHMLQASLTTMTLPAPERSTRDLPPSDVAFKSDVLFESWLAISRDGRYVAGTRDRQLVLWDMAAQRGRGLQSPALTYFESLHWSGRDLIAWTTLGSGARAWNARTGAPDDLGPAAGASSLSFSADGTRVAASDLFGAFTVFEIPGRRTIASRNVSDVGETVVALSHDGRRAALATSGALTLYDDALRTQRSIASLDAKSGIDELAFSPDGRWIASSLTGPRTMLRVHRADGAGEAVTLDSDDVHRQRPPGFSRDGRWMASLVRDRTVTIWNVGPWTVARSWALPRDGEAIAFSPDSARLAVAAETESTIWDASTGQRLITLATRDAANMRRIAWSPDGRRIATGGDDGVLRLWNAADGTLLGSLYFFEEGSDWILMAPDGRLDGSAEALAQFVAWRTGDRLVSDAAITQRARVPRLWLSLR